MKHFLSRSCVLGTFVLLGLLPIASAVAGVEKVDTGASRHHLFRSCVVQSLDELRLERPAAVALEVNAMRRDGSVAAHGGVAVGSEQIEWQSPVAAPGYLEIAAGSAGAEAVWVRPAEGSAVTQLRTLLGAANLEAPAHLRELAAELPGRGRSDPGRERAIVQFLRQRLPGAPVAGLLPTAPRVLGGEGRVPATLVFASTRATPPARALVYLPMRSAMLREWPEFVLEIEPTVLEGLIDLAAARGAVLVLPCFNDVDIGGPRAQAQLLASLAAVEAAYPGIRTELLAGFESCQLALQVAGRRAIDVVHLQQPALAFPAHRAGSVQGLDPLTLSRDELKEVMALNPAGHWGGVHVVVQAHRRPLHEADPAALRAVLAQVARTGGRVTRLPDFDGAAFPWGDGLVDSYRRLLAASEAGATPAPASGARALPAEHSVRSALADGFAVAGATDPRLAAWAEWWRTQRRNYGVSPREDAESASATSLVDLRVVDGDEFRRLAERAAGAGHFNAAAVADDGAYWGWFLVPDGERAQVVVACTANAPGGPRLDPLLDGFAVAGLWRAVDDEWIPVRGWLRR